MTESTPASSSIQINIKGKVGFELLCSTVADTPFVGPSELKLQIDISTDKTVRELKQAIADKSDVEADRQRLIYSGALSRCNVRLS